MSLSTIYMSQLSTLHLMEGDQDLGHIPTFSLAQGAPLLFPFVINNPIDQEPCYDQHFRQQELHPNEFNDQNLIGGSKAFTMIQSINDNMIEGSSCDPCVINTHADGTGKWMPSKMNIMKKTKEPGGATVKKPRRSRTHAYEDQAQTNSSSNQPMGGVVRVCSDCNTTKTPLWRSGPCGPKSLCNACGIRLRKARRAMAAAAAAAANGEVIVPNDAPSKPKKEKRPEIDRSLPFKKRCKVVHHDHPAKTVGKKNDSFDNKTIHNTFPKDETDAAILLMTLSCGLVRS